MTDVDLVGKVVVYKDVRRKVTRVFGDAAFLAKLDENDKVKRGRPIVVPVDLVADLVTDLANAVTLLEPTLVVAENTVVSNTEEVHTEPDIVIL